MTDAELGGKNNSLKISKTVSTYPLGEVSQVIPFAFRIVIVKSNLALSFNDLIFFYRNACVFRIRKTTSRVAYQHYFFLSSYFHIDKI